MKITALVTLLYGLIVLVSGLYAFIKYDSVWALLFGVIIGIILLGNAYGTFQQNFTGVYITILLSISLAIIFAVRLSRTLSILPVGLMFLSSVVTMGFSVYCLRLRKQKDIEKGDV